MTEIRTPHLTDNAIPSAAMWNNAFRAGMAEVAEALMFLLHGKTASAGAAGVMGGFELSTVTGQMQVSVAPGWGWFYDSTIAAPASPFAAFKLDTATTANVTAADEANARYDLISIQCVSDTDTELSVPTWQAANANRDTQRGSQPTVTVTAGTPALFPTIPATPAGHLALGAVRVGANVTNLNSATLIDLRDMLSLMARESTRPVRFRSRPNSSVVDAAEFILAEVLASGVADGSGSKLKWDRTNDWPVARRTIATAGEDASQDLFPMMVPGGRTWWRTLPWAMSPSLSGDDTKISMERDNNGRFKVVRVDGATSYGVVAHLVSGVDVRGLELVGAKLRYQCLEAFDSAIVQADVVLSIRKASGTLTSLVTFAIIINLAHGSVQTLTAGTAPTAALADTPILEDGDQIIAKMTIDVSNDGTSAGEVAFDTISLQFREGRTS